MPRPQLATELTASECRSLAIEESLKMIPVTSIQDVEPSSMYQIRREIQTDTVELRMTLIGLVVEVEISSNRMLRQ